ncbi:uncharacterized protein B0H18DRAFT_1020200 [Fomitopsis serialis]|uniref:uncharacterized protein n=1 Tax=Fomitopsis serialis TaxID=139415 RepID=UPI002007D354|nr:uncharacterized protein B0H18DRAFT_1020200 [Neoantrodia serialis]KAH9921794.1 hypothetical protein B0H18DRAFT_1020200 [Neoantrodia serialis]
MSSPSTSRLSPCCERCRTAKYTLVALSLVWASPASAAPAVAQELVRRDDGGMADAGPAAVAVWIPIVGVGLFIFASAMAYRMRKRSVTPTRTTSATSQTSSHQSLMSRMRAWSSRPVTVPGMQARELTAEQLAGTTGRSNRRRRPHSTASTRSTRSLPLYMKEPGEQEVVVFRGREDLTPGSANALLSPVQEGATPDTRRDSISSLAEPDTPLLDNAIPLTRARTEDLRLPSTIPMRRTISVRPSMDTVGGDSSESAAPSEDQHDHEHERGPAPPYRESIGQDSGVAFDDSTDAGHTQSFPVIDADGSAAEVDHPSAQRGSSSGTLRRPHLFGRGDPSSGSGNTSALSVPRLLSLFNPNRPNPGGESAVEGLPRSSDVGPLPPTPPSPVTPRRRPRGATVATPPGSPRPGSSGSPYRTHRPSHSGSASGLSAMFRSRSNTSGTALGAALTSPSTLSVHSISAPLTHTVVRTELMYPRAGPTPDQMKLLASVESFKQFGVPYGPDAIAFASTSRVDLLNPPPVFEEVVGQTGTGESGRDASASISRTGGEGLASDVREHSPGSSPSSSPEPSPQLPPGEPAAVARASQDDSAPSQETVEELSGEGRLQDSQQEEAQAKAPPTLSPYLPAQVAPAQPKEPLTADGVKKILRPLAPPTSFKGASVPAPLATPGSVRPGSRASSCMTFATAQEGESVPPTPAPEAEGPTMTEDGRMRESEEDLPSISPATPKRKRGSLLDADATSTILDAEDTKPDEAETRIEEAVVASSSDDAILRKSLDTTSITLPSLQADAPPFVAAQSEEVAV